MRKRAEKKGVKGDVWRAATAREAMEKGGVSGSLRKRGSKKMVHANILYGDQRYLLSPQMGAVEVPQNEAITGGEKNKKGKELVLLSVKEEQIRQA